MEHIKTKEMVHVSAETVAKFIVLTIADFSEQLFDWQDGTILALPSY